MLTAAIVTGIVGVLIGMIALRMRDIYLALATFPFGEAMQWVFANWNSVTGGPNGLRISPARLFGFEIVTDKQAYPIRGGIGAGDASVDDRDFALAARPLVPGGA